MNATLLLRERHVLDEQSFVELTIWKLPRTLQGSAHQFKYRLAYVVNDACILRYDNEAGKGDHRHIGSTESSRAIRFRHWTGWSTIFGKMWRACDEDGTYWRRHR